MDKIVKRIDRAVQEAEAEKNLRKPRTHLGGSEIGNRCARQIWYGYRWAYRKQFTGRLLRLFNRGHEEEHRFARFLTQSGYALQPFENQLLWHEPTDDYVLRRWSWQGDPTDQWDMSLQAVTEDPVHIARAEARGVAVKQWGFKDHDEHFAGNSDGKVKGPDLPEGWGLLEDKTHNDKSFKDLQKRGLLSAKPVHYIQMQTYMKYFGLEWGLYLAVNKNDDDLYPEVVYYKPEIGEFYSQRAKGIIEARVAPPRLSEDPSWFECRFCDYREICHYGEAPQKNCRSCVNARPAGAGGWYCEHFHQPIPPSFIPSGCDDWNPIR